MLFAVVAVPLLIACGGPPPASVNPAGTPRVAGLTQSATPVPTFDLPGADPRLAALRTTRAITIAEGSGSSYSSAVSGLKYTLVRTGDGFAGDGDFSVTGYAMGGRKLLTHTAAIRVAVPEAASATFLRQIASIPPLQGNYTQPSKPSHWYQQITITLETDEGQVEISIDPYPEATPLSSMRHGGAAWTSISRQPLDALDALEPYLRRAATLADVRQRVSRDALATNVAMPTPTLTPPSICRTPATSRVPPSTPATPASTPGTSILKPGDPIRVGHTINLVEYFDLPRPGSRPISVNADSTLPEADQTIRDPGRIAAFTAALDRPATVLAHPSSTTGHGMILLLVDLFGKSLGLGYFSQDELIGFSAGGASYTIAAPPEVRELLVQQLCH